MRYLDTTSSNESEVSVFCLKKEKRRKIYKIGSYEKNFPKNIIISMIKFLRLIFQSEICHELGISEQGIQKKNSAPLDDIYRILSHQRMAYINKTCLRRGTAIILLRNSKVLKKEFHLRILTEIFKISPEKGSQNFSKYVYSKANEIS